MRIRAFRFVVLAIVVCTLSGSLAFASDSAAVLVTGPKGERKITAAVLASLPRVDVVVSDHGKPAKFEGVLLYGILEQAGAPAGEALRGKELTQYVIVEASDGYRAVFSLAELSPAFSDRKAILAVDRDGKALPATEGPFRIAVEAEKRMARCVRQVTAIRIVDAK
jgi:hypothetical protein